MLLIAGNSAEALVGKIKRNVKYVDVLIHHGADNQANLVFRTENNASLSAVTSFRAEASSGKWIASNTVRWLSGTSMYVFAEVWDTAPPVTASNRCGLYLYNAYNQLQPVLVDGLYVQNIRAEPKWYAETGDVGWFSATQNANNGRYNWVFRFDIPIEYE